MPVAMSARPDPSRYRVRLMSVSEVVRVRLAVRDMGGDLAWRRAVVQRSTLARCWNVLARWTI